MLEQRIQRQFFESADLQYQAAEALARPVAQAAESVIGAFTSGASLLVCGQEGGQSLARHAAHVLLGQLERQRPPLAALAIEADPRAIQALGQPGGVLLIVDPLARATEAEMTLIGAAHDKDMSVILLAGRDAGALSETLSESDVLIAVPHERVMRVLEVQLLVLHALCDAVDVQLMGEQE
ncbi:MAG TPA: phosphoheptose isomerase [Rubrivivax sp.]|jgi:D-sedoheptulose 7-phosphate isomerase|nr:phosphoheptose isomerase [Rubrivivax sp.]